MDKEKVSEACVLDWIPGCSTIRAITHSSRIATVSVPRKIIFCVCLCIIFIVCRNKFYLKTNETHDAFRN